MPVPARLKMVCQKKVFDFELFGWMMYGCCKKKRRVVNIYIMMKIEAEEEEAKIACLATGKKM